MRELTRAKSVTRDRRPPIAGDQSAPTHVSSAPALHGSAPTLLSAMSKNSLRPFRHANAHVRGPQSYTIPRKITRLARATTSATRNQLQEGKLYVDGPIQRDSFPISAFSAACFPLPHGTQFDFLLGVGRTPCCVPETHEIVFLIIAELGEAYRPTR